MRGRWASLAISAAADKRLDFSQISRDDPRSLLLERLMLSRTEDDRRLSNMAVQRLFEISMAQGHHDSFRTMHLEKLSRDALLCLFPWQRSISDSTDQAERDAAILKGIEQVLEIGT